MRRGMVGGFLVSVAAAVCIAVGVQAEKQPERANTYLVQLSGPVLDQWKAAIADEGGELLDYVPQFAFRVRMAPDAAARVRRLGFVTAVQSLQREQVLAPNLRRNGQRLYTVRLEPGARVDDVVAALRAAGVQVLSRGRQLMIAADSGQLDQAGAIDGIATISNFALRIKHNEYGGGAIMGANLANASGYDGSTQTIGISDTGLGLGTAASAHPDLPASRVTSIFNWPGTSDFCFDAINNDGAQDVDTGHGTHVAIAALGGGNSNGVGRGTAPAAHLVFQAIENYAIPSLLCSILYGYPEGYYLIGIPDDVGDLFDQAYLQGARVHSNSWGAEVAGEYNADAANADAFVWSHRDLAVTFSAGNSGTDANNDGVVDLDSINSPGTAKNVITVGASENDRQSHWECDAALSYTACASQGGQNDIFTYGAAWPDRYAANPLRDDPSAGNAEQMAAFSSRGPTNDGRIKPDVVAPGTWNLSGYSSPFQQQYDPSPNPLNGEYQYDGWGFPASSSYKYMGGTSMAAPLVAGGAAVVRDFYEKARAHNASAALVKAVLINSAVDLLDENNDGVLDNANPIPNAHEGWGRVDLVNATDATDLYFDETVPLSTGASTSLTFDVTSAGAPFKATLAWTDYPSSTSAVTNLVNDLDLTVTAPDGTIYKGNVFSGGWSVQGGAADRLNNVENVYVFAAAAGTWTVTVNGYNIPQGPQPFALVVDTPSEAGGLPMVRVTVDDNTATESGPTGGLLRFTRSGDTSAALEVAYNVSGSAVAGADYTALSGFVTIPEGALDATVAVDALDDAFYESTETVIVTVVPTAAYRVGSPSTGAVTISSDDLPPDLAVSAMTAPAWVAAGSTVNVTVTTKNQGSGSADSSHTGLYFSTNTTWDAADTYLGDRAVPALGASATDVATVSVVIPGGALPGTFYVIGKADWDSTVGESSENNNTRASGAVKVGPDLLVSAVTVPATANAGDPLTITDTTKNQGAAPASATTTAFYLSSNTALDASDVFLGSRAVNPLAFNATHVESTIVTIPLSTTVGSYYVLAQADSGGAVAEFQETNNLRASAIVKIGADLSVTTLTAPAEAGAGVTFDVTETTANLGATDSPDSITRFYLSVNPSLDATDTPVGSRLVLALDAGASSTVVAQVTIPASTTTGTYYLFANADDDHAIAETVETNNSKKVTIKIGPDLTIDSITPTVATQLGGTLDIADSIRNVGGGLAPASQTSYYLSANSVLDAADVYLGARAVPSLAPDAVSAGTTTVTVPAETLIGVYYVFAKADSAGAIGEVSETNNNKISYSIRVGADLSVPTLTGGASVVRGTPMTLTDTTRNDGSPVGATTTAYYLSLNSTIDASDLLLGTRTVGPLATATQETGSITFVIPASQPTGTYYVLAKADDGNVSVETNETNNTKAKSITVKP